MIGLSSESLLVRAALATGRSHVTDYMGDGAYPAHRAEKEEAEEFVAAVIAELDAGAGARLADELAAYLRAMYPPDALEQGRQDHKLRQRQIAFAALQRAVDTVLDDLDDRSFERPAETDPVFIGCPQLLSRRTKDGLIRLEPGDVAEESLRGEGILALGETAIYAHPLLAPARELVLELLDLAAQGDLSVAIAVHPFRVTRVDEVQFRLLEDYWYGIKVDAKSLDSLDPHDVGVRTFHVARQGTVERFFLPLLGSWFDWERRSRHNPSDPVKRLYVREVRPAADRHGAPLTGAINRELHAERDTAARRFTHVDGKVCFYDATTYLPTVERPDAPLGEALKSRKLWRVDGAIDDATWQRLTGLHFRQNELIQEHFDAALANT